MSEHPARQTSQQMTVGQAIEVALTHHRSGRLDEAARIYQQVLQAEPAYPDALYLSGRIEQQRGDFDRAADLFRRAIAADPQEATFHNNLGEALRAQGNLAEAVGAYRQALRLKPDYALAHHNLALALHQQQDAEGAEAAFREALRLAPDFVAALHNFGLFLCHERRWAEAHANLAEAVRLKPDFVEALSALGDALRHEGNLPAAIDACRRALAIRPDYAAAQANLGNALHQSGRFGEALAALQQAVAFDSRDAETYTNLAVVYHELRRLDEAIDASRRAIELRPELAMAHNNLASYLHARGQIEDAMQHMHRAVELAPDDLYFHGNLAHALNYAPGVDAQTIYEEHVGWARRYADPLTPADMSRPVDCSLERRLRIGYVSPYFFDHAVNVFVEPILKMHDHANYEIVCYSDVKRPDDATDRLRTFADSWVDAAGTSDAELAERIATDSIDILVDLSGYLAGNRLLTFARKPAPIQVSYIGYQNTTGMAAMDFRVTDEYADPTGMTDEYYTEQLVRLPRSFFCYQPAEGAPEVNPLPARASGYVTFASFHKFAKVSAHVLTTWATILSQVERSRLIILADHSAEMVRRVHTTFAARGVAPHRVEFVPKRSRLDYLRLHHDVDIALDAFPFNGHTTTCESLWMGVPVVMLAGTTYVSRYGGTALVTLGLDDLIAKNREQYVQIAGQLATDWERLETLRGELRGKMAASALLDAKSFTRDLEDAYRRMWHDFCDSDRRRG